MVIANQQAPAEVAYHLGFWETLDLGRWETKTFPKTAVRFSGRCFYAVGKLIWLARPVRAQWILVRTRKSLRVPCAENSASVQLVLSRLCPTLTANRMAG